MEQMHQFAGNMVEIKNKNGHPFIWMSTRFRQPNDEPKNHIKQTRDAVACATL